LFVLASLSAASASVSQCTFILSTSLGEQV
jgi:hypothetical protein